MPIAADDLRAIMRQWATGITLVTSAHDGAEPHGMTVTSFTSVSLDPPLVVVSLENSSRTHQLVSRSGVFAVSILHHDQQELAERFAGRVSDDRDRFEGLRHRRASSGAPIPEGCLAYLDCRVVQVHRAGTHTLFVGEVLEGAVEGGGSPLLYYDREYRRLNG
jgi:flavin reductase (DIM6/NTAB) family NADH-FMN oxidoreductase RutF